MPRNSPTVCLTGGGTLGHVTPHFALLPLLRAEGFNIIYMGSYGIEKPLVEEMGIPYYAIPTGKLRRYASWQNLVDIGRIIAGLVMAIYYLAKTRPACVFSKGGFVAVPVAWAAWLLRIPVLSHESDLTPGLANKLIKPIAHKILYTFPETSRYLPKSSVLVGSPIRKEILSGNRAEGLRLCEFSADDKPTLLVMGGSQGALRINQALQEILPELTKRYHVVHLTGKGKALPVNLSGYKGFEFLSSDLRHIYALCDAVICRAGANSIFELLALRKPMLLIPLEAGSRGDQVLNAASFTKQGWALTLREADITPKSLTSHIDTLLANKAAITQAQASYDSNAATAKVVAEIKAVVDKI